MWMGSGIRCTSDPILSLLKLATELLPCTAKKQEFGVAGVCQGEGQGRLGGQGRGFGVLQQLSLVCSSLHWRF